MVTDFSVFLCISEISNCSSCRSRALGPWRSKVLPATLLATSAQDPGTISIPRINDNPSPVVFLHICVCTYVVYDK